MKRRKLSRREWLQEASRLTAGASLLGTMPADVLGGTQASQTAAAAQTAPAVGPNGSMQIAPIEGTQLFPSDPTKYRFTSDEDKFLELFSRTTFEFFWNETNVATGLVKDRSLADGSDTRNVASIAATGFGLTGMCIADRRGWQDGNEIRVRVRNGLRFVATKVPQEHGFFAHFVNIQTGERVLQSEVSSIDTAIFLCGVITCRAYFDDPEIKDMATRIVNRVDWPWMLHGEKTLSQGWTPEHGFLRYRWDAYCELMMMYLLGMGSSTHAIPADTWDAWSRLTFEFDHIRYLGSQAPLFVHQFSHAWFDFRGKHDKYVDYFANSVVATKVHKLWCQELAQRFPNYGEDMWGISSSDSARGYQAWGGPPPMGPVDGSIVPSAAAGSLPFLPLETIRVLQNVRESLGKKVWHKYGFVDAFNTLTNWYSSDVLGIDAGIGLLMAENVRSGFVWEQFMKDADVQRGMAKAGFKPNVAVQALGQKTRSEQGASVAGAL